MGKARKLIVFGIILIALSAIAIISFQNKLNENGITFKGKESKNSSNSKLEGTVIFPEFTSIDMFGNTINESTIKGKNTFVQFIDPRSKDQVEYIKKVCQEFEKNELTVLLFIKDTESYLLDQFVDEIKFALGDIFIVTENYETYKKIFKSPSCCESSYLFDQSGKLILEGLNWKLTEYGTRVLQEGLENNKSYFFLDFIKPGENINNFNEFKCISEHIRKNEEYNHFIISMFNNICMDCPSGRILKELITSHEIINDSVSFLVILSENYDENDIENMKDIFKIKFPIIKADEGLLKKWKYLDTKTGTSKLSNIVFLVDKNGKVVEVMKPPFQKEFFSNLIRLNGQEKTKE